MIPLVGLLVLLVAPTPSGAVAPESASRGGIAGRVSDASNGRALAGVGVRVVGTDLVATTDDGGAFRLDGVPAGSHVVGAELAGYAPARLAPVEVRDGQTTEIDLALEPSPIRLQEEVQVLGRLPRRSESSPGDAFTLTGAQLTTVPGTLGDFGRTLRSTPAAAGSSDERNTIVARGGNPLENGFFVDNVEVPGISHLPDWSSTGGFYSLIDPSAVESFDFIVGGLPPRFGGFLSSVTDIAYREGSREHFAGQARFDIAMAAAALEGPLPGRRGSWRLSVRHADFVYLKEVLSLDNGNPRWTDAHAKVVYDLSPRHSLTVVDLFSSDRLLDDGVSLGAERTEIDQNTAGINWRATWSDRLRSETSVSHSWYARYLGEEYDPPEDAYDWSIDRRTEWVAVRNENTMSIGQAGLVSLGIQARRLSHDVRYLVVPTRPGTVLISTGPWELRTTETAGFLSAGGRLFSRFRANAGLRLEHSTASRRSHLAPRVSASFQLHGSWLLNGSAAVVYQPLPPDFLAMTRGALDLRDMRADQYSLGMSLTSRRGWQGTVEVYTKRYSGLPIDPEAPHRLALDREPFRDYTVPVSLVDTGTGRARGVELMIERRVGNRFSGLVAARVSRDTYRDARGVQHDRLYDSRYGLTVAADWTPNGRWNLSATLAVQDGTPYTPTREDLSLAWGTWVRDGARYNTLRYPTYVSLNARAERRFAVGKTTLAVYADVWNLLDRKNVGWIKGWSPGAGEIFEYQMPRTPFVGAGVVF